MAFDGCQAVFDWQTSAACPQEYSEGVGCEVTDPDTGYSYDLTALMSRTDYMCAQISSRLWNWVLIN